MWGSIFYYGNLINPYLFYMKNHSTVSIIYQKDDNKYTGAFN